MQLYSKQSPDKDLVELTRQGHGNAFGELYDRYFDLIFRYFYFRVSNRHDAEDLTETVFLRTLEAILHKNANIHNFKAWLFRSAHNILVDHYRAKKNQVDFDEVEYLSDVNANPDASSLDGSDRMMLRQAIARLEPNLQQVISLRFIAGLSYVETAEVMDLNRNHLRVLQHRALKQLKFYLSMDLKQYE